MIWLRPVDKKLPILEEGGFLNLFFFFLFSNNTRAKARRRGRRAIVLLTCSRFKSPARMTYIHHIFAAIHTRSCVPDVGEETSAMHAHACRKVRTGEPKGNFTPMFTTRPMPLVIEYLTRGG